MSDRAPVPPAGGHHRPPTPFAAQPQDALLDPLTALPNRVLLMDRLRQARARARRRESRLALLFLDLDRFKSVNDTFGHLAGDQLLVSLAQRLCACLRPEDTVARLGGDEFVVLLDGVDRAGVAKQVAERIIVALEEPFHFQEHQILCRASVGIATSGGEEEAEDLLADADAAMYRAKAEGGGRFLCFEPAMRQHLEARRQLAAELLAAVEERQLGLVFQPIVDLPRGRLLAREALLRWHHPERGALEPGAFLEVAKQSGLILPIGCWVLGEACLQASRWPAAEGPPPAVSVNLSRAEVTQPTLREHVGTALSRSGLAPSRLWLDLPASVLQLHPDSLVARLETLSQLGVKAFLDGFGLQCTPLSTLRQLPLHGVKIDRSFVARMRDSKADFAIARALLELGKALGLMVIAEGVEEPHQRSELERLGCDAGQGFLLGSPRPLEATA